MSEKRNDRTLRATGLGKCYRRKGAPPVQVIEDCDIEVEPGKLTVVMGVSGCGKSTLAYLLAGYLKPDEGSVSMDGDAVTGPGPDRLLVFQETALWPWMTVLDNVVFGPLARKEMDRRAAEKEARDLLQRFGLGEFRDKYPGQLSGGMKRRAEIAQALMNRPEVMILDEPFRGLDEMTRELMQEYYLKLFEESALTTLFITAELEEAIFLADRILVMGGQPANIVATIDVDLPHPRTFEMLDSEQYLALKKRVMQALYAQSQGSAGAVA
jgi:NitT/TauT family transport system ATP-binding protein